jgi:hypothetical protein
MDSTSLQQAKFEDLLGKRTVDDLVRLWSEYAKWIAKHRPSEYVSVLARACKQLTDDPKHHDDIRFLRLWIQFADSQGKVATHTFFGSLEEQGIGTRHALLYEAWAASLETKRLFLQADAVYTRGIKRSAQPLTRLQTRATEFRNRMARRKNREVRRSQRASKKVDRKHQTSGRSIDDAKQHHVQVTRAPDEKSDRAASVPTGSVASADLLKHHPLRMPLSFHGTDAVSHQKLDSTSIAGNASQEGSFKEQQQRQANRDRSECVRSAGVLATREQRRLTQSRPLTQSRLLAHNRRFSLRLPIRRSLSKMQDMQSGKRRRRSSLPPGTGARTQHVSRPQEALGTTSDMQSSIVEASKVGKENAESEAGVDGIGAIGEQILAERSRQISACDVKQRENNGDIKMADNASSRIPRWLPFRYHGC